MRILIVSQWFVKRDLDGKIDIPGGTERYAYGLAKQLREDGHEVMALFATRDKDAEGWKVLDEIDIYGFKVPDRFYGYLADLLSFANTVKVIRTFKPDIVHIVSTRYRFAVGSIMASKIMKKKVVYTKTIPPHDEGRKMLPVLLDKFIFSKMAGWSDILIALSKETEGFLIKETKHKRIVIIPSFFMGDYYKERSKDPHSILFVGRLDIVQKGTDYLIKALYYVKEEIHDVKLHIVGEGDSMRYLKELVSKCGLGDNVIFCGHIPETQLFEMYAKSEILAMPSLREGMPMVLLEALSAGLPIVAFDIDCIAEALEDGKYGILVKQKDAKELADQIIGILKNEELRDYYSKMSSERSKKYSLAEVTRNIEQVYYSLMD